MPENEFEKQVKDVMGSFSMVPPDAAWDELSRRINTEKRKRRYFIFFLLLALIVAGVAAYSVIGKKANTFSQSGIEKNKTAVPQNDQQLSADSNQHSPAPKLFDQKKTNIHDNNKIAGAQKKPELHIVKKQRPAGAFQSLYPPEKLNAADKSKKIPGSEIYQQQPLPDKHADKTGESLEKKTSQHAEATATTTEKNTWAATANNQVTDSLHSASAPEKNSPTVIADENNHATKKQAATVAAIPSWEWGIHIGYGKSNLLNASSENEKSYPASLSGPSAAPVYNAQTPSKVFTASDAYQAGFTLQRRVSKNSVIGAGLNYLHYSVQNGVSSLVYSGAVYRPSSMTGLSIYTVPGYYRPGSESKYMNTYNFIELPVYFQQYIFRSKSTALAYQAGVTLRQLLSQKSLVYDAFNNVYYADDNLLRKTQFQFAGGLKFSFNTGKKSAVFIGPHFSYSLSNFYNDKDKGNFHFMQYGIQAGIMFHKK